MGNDNFFPFGLTAPEVYALRASGYDPAACYHSNPQLRAVIDLVQQGFFSRGDPALFRPLFNPQQMHDPYLLMADFASYIECQEKVSQAFAEPARWQRMSVLSCARSGRFSSDRAIREYCERIWHIEPVPVRLLHRASGAPWQGESPVRAA